MSRGLMATAIVAVGLFTALPAAATPIVDQEYVIANPDDGLFVSLSSSQPALAQTFTVGISGELAYAEAQLWDVAGLGGLDYYITSLSGGLPDTVLASGSITAGDVTDSASAAFTTLEFNDFSVSAGQQLALVLRISSTDSVFAWLSVFGGSYAGGQTAVDGGSGFVASPSFDLGFRTYVDPATAAPVPEPASILLLGSGLAGAALKSRRTHRRRRQS